MTLDEQRARLADLIADSERGQLGMELRTRPGFILIVSRNNLHLTQLAVRSALAQDMPCDILLIDNASQDDTPRWAAGKSSIAYCAYPKQRSLAACWNNGLMSAWAANYIDALVLNNDVEIRPDTYRLLRARNKPFVTCVSVDDPKRLNYPEPPGPDERPHPDFSAFMIRRDVTQRVGWFDEQMYPAYCEDSDYHVRMHRAGVEAVCIDLPFLHHGASTIRQSDPVERRAIENGANRNRQRFRQLYGCMPGDDKYQELFT